jgi:hypothetical protein
MLITKKNKFNFIIIALFFSSFIIFSCKKKSSITPTETKTELIIKNSWVIDRFTNADNSVIQEGKLNTSAKLLYLLEFQFRNNNQVKAIDKVSKQVFNGGSWEFKNNEKNILIDIPGLKDEFILVDITKNKLILRPNEKVFPIVDNATVVNMEFKPTL